MLYYYRIDVSKGADVNKTSASKECTISQYCYFHNKLPMSGFAILNIRSVDYCCIIKRVNKSKAINLLQSANLDQKHRSL